MTTPGCPDCRDEIVRHFRDGAPWSAAARDHYAGCVDCITEVTSLLSQRAKVGAVRLRGSTSQPPVPEAARRALEHGREVLAREFGIQSGNPAEPT